MSLFLFTSCCALYIILIGFCDDLMVIYHVIQIKLLCLSRKKSYKDLVLFIIAESIFEEVPCHRGSNAGEWLAAR